jgi:hypothetical protein
VITFGKSIEKAQKMLYPDNSSGLKYVSAHMDLKDLDLHDVPGLDDSDEQNEGDPSYPVVFDTAAVVFLTKSLLKEISSRDEEIERLKGGDEYLKKKGLAKLSKEEKVALGLEMTQLVEQLDRLNKTGFGQNDPELGFFGAQIYDPISDLYSKFQDDLSISALEDLVFAFSEDRGSPMKLIYLTKAHWLSFYNKLAPSGIANHDPVSKEEGSYFLAGTVLGPVKVVLKSLKSSKEYE